MTISMGHTGIISAEGVNDPSNHVFAGSKTITLIPAMSRNGLEMTSYVELTWRLTER